MEVDEEDEEEEEEEQVLSVRRSRIEDAGLSVPEEQEEV